MSERKLLAQETSSQDKKMDKWAVIVGISEYQYQPWNLNYAHRDAEELYKLLLTKNGSHFKKENITLLTNQQATKRNIGIALHDFLQKPDRDDLVIIYFACHGAPDPNRPNNNLYLLTYDTEPDKIAATGLRMQEINDALKDILIAEKVIILADTCHSGGIGGRIGNRNACQSSDLMNRYLHRLSNSKGGVALLTSAEAREVSREGKQWGGGHGVFTHFVLEGMRGAADEDGDGIVTTGELFEYVREKVKQETDYRQHPHIGSNGFDRNLPLAIANKQIQILTFQVITVKEAELFTEDLGDGVTLEMVKIPGGKFLMGTEDEEIEKLCQTYNVEHFRRERPQHEVNVPSFWMGQYPITQAQWRIVAGWESIERELNPDPSYFKDNYEGRDRWTRPVENISWEEAVEFCARLSKKTNGKYRLPTEAEWEYACRAGTVTPFHFGKTISTKLANYRGTDFEYEGKMYPGNYGNGLKGIYRKQTTPVGYFQVANAFGLYDMHGNVWEWCADYPHNSYDGAPRDGSAWVTGGNPERRIVRGGSWNDLPANCRSAHRNNNTPANRNFIIGFRVVCAVLPGLF